MQQQDPFEIVRKLAAEFAARFQDKRGVERVFTLNELSQADRATLISKFGNSFEINFWITDKTVMVMVDLNPDLKQPKLKLLGPKPSAPPPISFC